MCGCAIDAGGERKDVGTQTSKVKARDAIRIMLEPQRDYSFRPLTLDACGGVTFSDDRSQCLERAKGIEPSYAAWEAAVLPLNYARILYTYSILALSSTTVVPLGSHFVFRGGRRLFPPASVLQSRRQTEPRLPPRPPLHAPNEVGSLNQRSFHMSAGLQLFEQQRLDVAKNHGGIEGLVRIDLADKALLVDQIHF